MAPETPVTHTSELLITTLGDVAVDGVLSTTVFPDDVETVFELLLTVLETVEEVTVSVAVDAIGYSRATSIKASPFLFIGISPQYVLLLLYYLSSSSESGAFLDIQELHLKTAT